jgi:hypothetical protein
MLLFAWMCRWLRFAKSRGRLDDMGAMQLFVPPDIRMESLFYKSASSSLSDVIQCSQLDGAWILAIEDPDHWILIRRCHHYYVAPRYDGFPCTWTRHQTLALKSINRQE